MSDDKLRRRLRNQSGQHDAYLRDRLSTRNTDRIPTGHRFEFPPGPKEAFKAATKKHISRWQSAFRTFARSLPKRLKTARQLPIKYVAVSAVVLIVIFAGFNILNSPKKQEPKAVLSGTTSQNAPADLPREKPFFDILYPASLSAKDTEVVKISPEGREPAYTIVDATKQGSRIQITQQQLPAAFKNGAEAELEKTAKNFQATNIIQIDDIKVYHGYSERTKVQSLVLIKNNLLIFIASNNQLADEFWAGYIKGLR